MKKKKQTPIVISLGGSLVYPNGGVNTPFIRTFVRIIRARVKRGERFAIVVGGGAPARLYIEAMQKINPAVGEDDLHWAGIAASRANATLVRGIFGRLAHGKVIRDPSLAKSSIFRHTPILMAGGEKPGQSTDTVAVKCAQSLGVTRVVNLSNVDYIYDKDPKLRGAKKQTMMTWKNLQSLLPKRHAPGLHTPFDPVAARIGAKHNMQLIFSGGDMNNLRRMLDGKAFHGSVVMG